MMSGWEYTPYYRIMRPCYWQPFVLIQSGKEISKHKTWHIKLPKVHSRSKEKKKSSKKGGSGDDDLVCWLTAIFIVLILPLSPGFSSERPRSSWRSGPWEFSLQKAAENQGKGGVISSVGQDRRSRARGCVGRSQRCSTRRHEDWSYLR